MKPVIHFQDFSFNYYLPDQNNTSLKFLLSNPFKIHKINKLNVFKKINLKLFKNEKVAFIGKNGSGKSTLIKIIDGVYKIYNGSLKLNGNIYAIYDLGLILNDNFDAKDNIRIFLSSHGYRISQIKDLEKKIINYCEFDENIKKLPISKYSSGMKNRLILSCFIFLKMKKPYSLLFDEALVYSDQHFQKKISKEIDKKIKDSKLFVMVSHNRDLLKKYCSSAVLFKSNNQLVKDKLQKILKIYDQ